MKTICTLLLLLICIGGAFADEKMAPASPYETLRSVTSFSIGGTGFAGTISSGEKALRALLQQPDGATQFTRLLRDATPEGQLYALIGLRTLDPKAFATAAPKYLRSDAEVKTISGCIDGPRPVKEIATEIEAGKLK